MQQEGVAETRAPYRLRVHQARALDAIERAEATGARRSWVVLPPGAGKTLVGLETARRRGRTTVVLGPNTAIQSQWLRGWTDLVGDGDQASGTRAVDTFFTALTYQSLATFDPDAEVDEDGVETGAAEEGSLLDRLHPNGRALVERLKEVGDLTLVLDECHHLLQVWGRLLQEVLDELPDAFVLGLTATPPDTLTADQRVLVDELFGDSVFSVSIPAVVREGDLAPFAELAWLTTPTSTENDWLAAQGERFAELTTALSDPAYGSTGFFAWLDERYDAGEPPDAALRMVHAGLMTLPDGARLSERHRHDPGAEDWVLLLEGWAAHLRTTGEDDAVLERIRAVLPSVGYQLTRRGIRRGRSPVDRVLARSEAKVVALTEIVGAERRGLGERMRMLVLCDHEQATATLPADLDGVLSQEAGSARLALRHLEDALPDLHPVLVTGRTVTGSAETMKALHVYVATYDPDLALRAEQGRWTSREWVPWVTRFFEEGHCHVLVGTRGLLGEGWDARAVTGLVDLTTATTSTAVVQTRGRALRTDPYWPEKVALTWSVVCVSEDHPKGGNDWNRFVRKHEGFYGVDAEGEVVAGVAHVDDAFSPYAAPPVSDFDAVNARMLARAEERETVREAWAVGTPYTDTFVHTVRITTRIPAAPVTAPAPVVLHDGDLRLRDGRPAPWRPHFALAVGLVLAALAFLLNLTPAAVVGIGVVTMLGIQTTVAVDRGRRIAEDLARPPGLEQVAFAVADGLHSAGLTSAGAAAVSVEVDTVGERRCALEGVPPEESAAFASALDEVVSPMASPRYVLPRWVLAGPVDNGDGLRVALGRLRADGELWHSVPTVLGTTGKRAQAFAAAWDRWVGGGPAIYTGSPQGEGVLVTTRGSDPFAATTVLRTSWR
ncbi:DEAD/DEAH box helicase family protein [Nocardioides panacis]|uniref:DEAD/DEAH box helicase family protein n=1 Tax=Nocardioides panacis TaxID=2849501 RepID=A0A975Y173_9ACTN|nr:DEAD/DEAH box helicase family protein [Nocardioides panacis]QWZ09216.1 DEAD/DEAH box helicase family protein [Nocardioides panacis]